MPMELHQGPIPRHSQKPESAIPLVRVIQPAQGAQQIALHVVPAGLVRPESGENVKKQHQRLKFCSLICK